jgi:hypothetical protein
VTTYGPVLTTGELARALGWSVRRTRRWLCRAGATHRVGGRYVTTREALIAAFPGAYEAVGAIADDATPGCAECDVLRLALLERDEQIELLVRRLGASRSGSRGVSDKAR